MTCLITVTILSFSLSGSLETLSPIKESGNYLSISVNIFRGIETTLMQ